MKSSDEALHIVAEGKRLRSLGNLDLALDAFSFALKIDPDCAEAYNYSAVVYFERGRLTEAERLYDRALEIRENYAEALNNKANLLNVQGRIVESYNCYAKAVAIRPELFQIRSNLLLSMNYNPLLYQQEIYEESLKWESCQPSIVTRFIHPKSQLSISPKKIRIGYVSPDFRCHSVAYFLEPLLKNHDKNCFEIFCYSDVVRHDATTTRFRSYADVWQDTHEMNDDELAQCIYHDDVHILVDLTGHTANNRLRVFAAKPAPVQVSWLGYPNTTGLSTIDYRITDDIADPEGADCFYSEKLMRLASGFLCYLPPKDAPPVSERPHIRNRFITFGSFNSIPKISPELVAVWAAVLKRVKGSEILLKSKYLADPTIRSRCLGLFAEFGIRPERIKLLGAEPSMNEHLNRYAEMDIALDTFPYNGTTTTCEALWMGVPVVTLKGDRHSGRVGASILSHVGLNEFIAVSSDEYVNIAVRAAHNIDSLVLNSVRERLLASPLCNGDLFARSFESALRDMWEMQANKPGAV